MKRGFTLIEILAVITLLGLLALIVLPNVLNQKTKKEREIKESEKKILYSDAASYIYEKGTYEILPGNTFCINIQDMINDNMISMDAEDFKTKKIKVTVDENSNFMYSIVNLCEN